MHTTWVIYTNLCHIMYGQIQPTTSHHPKPNRTKAENAFPFQCKTKLNDALSELQVTIQNVIF